MLRDALQQNHNQPTVSERIEVDRVVQSQSLLQHQNSAKKFVPYDLASKPTNDDHIIACALAEQESWAAESEGSLSGGVVMITSDNNMTCKALSNGLKVFSPTDFHEYYLEHMESLRQRSRR
jgi:predicted ribonuclease YlaK